MDLRTGRTITPSQQVVYEGAFSGFTKNNDYGLLITKRDSLKTPGVAPAEEFTFRAVKSRWLKAAQYILGEGLVAVNVSAPGDVLYSGKISMPAVGDGKGPRSRGANFYLDPDVAQQLDGDVQESVTQSVVFCTEQLIRSRALRGYTLLDEVDDTAWEISGQRNIKIERQPLELVVRRY